MTSAADGLLSRRGRAWAFCEEEPRDEALLAAALLPLADADSCREELFSPADPWRRRQRRRDHAPRRAHARVARLRVPHATCPVPCATSHVPRAMCHVAMCHVPRAIATPPREMIQD